MATPVNISQQEAEAFMQERALGEYTLLDVRQDWEYAEAHLPGARHVPLPELADRLAEVPEGLPVLAYCRSGRRSEAAAGLLAGQGYAVMNIVGGIMAWQGAAAEGPPERGLGWLPEAASLGDVLALAYAMEANLGGFYAEAAARDGDAARAKTFTELARFEEGHKAMVLRLARELAGGLDADALMARATGLAALEGGFTPEEARARFAASGAGTVEILEAALAFEAQALDLYLRAAPRMESSEAQRALRELAEEEKRHLAVVGRMLTRAGG